MATFLMIHGSWHGGWAFEPLRVAIERAGHRLIAPDLPSAGADRTPLASVTLESWADFVSALACAQSDPVILCGHSRGGIVISEAAERSPHCIAALVYICAFLLPAGRSLGDHTATIPRSDVFQSGLVPLADGSGITITGEAARAAFYHRAPSMARDDACARLCAEPLAPMVTPLTITPERYGSVPRHYIECLDDQALTIAEQRGMHAEMPCASVTTLDSDHSPFLTCPDRLVDALVRIAAPY